MAKMLDFTKVKKEYWTVKLDDEKKTVLMIGTPTKAILNEFLAINEAVDENGGADGELIEDIYRVCANIMSFNKGGIRITPEYLENFFTVSDVMLFFNGYSEFMSSMTNAKN